MVATQPKPRFLPFLPSDAGLFSFPTRKAGLRRKVWPPSATLYPSENGLARSIMNKRTRKFFGMVLLVSWIILYAAVGMTIGAAVVANAGGGVQILFFIVSGALWVVPAGLIIRWMEKD